jgi:predicted HicB family RNase H-like nuclease
MKKMAPSARSRRSVAAKSAELLSHAKHVAETTTDWMEVFNAIYAPGAIYSLLFSNKQERIAFAQTTEHTQLYELFWKLRDQRGDPTAEENAEVSKGSSGSFLIRMPRALHAALVAEAEQQGVSLNLLCVSKLAMRLGETSTSKARGGQRRAG